MQALKKVGPKSKNSRNLAMDLKILKTPTMYSHCIFFSGVRIDVRAEKDKVVTPERLFLLMDET